MEERTPQAAEPSKLKKILKEWIIPFGIEILVVLLLVALIQVKGLRSKEVQQ